MRGGTMASMMSSTVQDADNENADDDIDETAPMTRPGKLATKFKRRARPPSHKDPEENKYRVSFFQIMNMLYRRAAATGSSTRK